MPTIVLGQETQVPLSVTSEKPLNMRHFSQEMKHGSFISLVKRITILLGSLTWRNVVHFAHDPGFTNVVMSARWEDCAGEIREVITIIGLDRY